jgi:predicted ATP-grasp superfamily ATP-dependent carboligase
VRVLIAGLTTRALAESAVRAGAAIVTVDYFGDLDQERLCETHSLRELGRGYSAAAILEAARELAYDAVVYCGGLENHPGVVAELGRGRVLLGNAPETLRGVRDPVTLLPYLARHGFQVPETLSATDPLPASGRWLSKPARGGGGQGVRRWDGRPLAATHILQEHVEGVSASVAFVADGRRSVVLAWTEQLHSTGGFRYAGNVMPLDGPAAAREEVGAIADALTREYGLRGLNGLDFVLRDDRPAVLEVNPRYCASMELVERASGASVFDLHVAACQGQLPARMAEPSGVWGKAIVYATRTVKVPDTTAWLAEGVRDVPHPGDVIRAGHPICTVLASAPTRAGCVAELRAETARIRAACAPIDLTGPPDDLADEE